MEKLTLEHLAPYLPYKLMCQAPKHRFKYGETESLLMTGLDCNYNNEMNVEFLRNDDLEFSNTMKYIKPILRPLSDLTKEITIEGETFIPMEWFHENYVGETMFKNPATWSHRAVNKMFKWHFDVFSLTDKNLAIDINTI